MALPCLCSNVLPMEVDIQRDFFTESSPSALRAVFSSWSLEGCKQWCARHPICCRATGQACAMYKDNGLLSGLFRSSYRARCDVYLADITLAPYLAA